MKIRTSIRLLLATSLLTVSSAFAQDYDIAILNGRVMDPESNFDGVRNVGVKDGKIVRSRRTSSPARRPSTPRVTSSPPALSRGTSTRPTRSVAR